MQLYRLAVRFDPYMGR